MVSDMSQAHNFVCDRVQELKHRVNVTTRATQSAEDLVDQTGTSKTRRTLASVVAPNAADTIGLARLSADAQLARAAWHT